MCCWRNKEKKSKTVHTHYYEYRQQPDYILKRKIKKLRKKQNREYCFGSLYTTTAIGSTIATVLSPITAVASIPTAIASVVATVDNITKFLEYKSKHNELSHILEQRQNHEISIKSNLYFPVITKL